MTTTASNIATVEKAIPEFVKLINKDLISNDAFGVTNNQDNPNPVAVGFQEGATGDLEIHLETLGKSKEIYSNGFTEEFVDDVFAMLGETDAVSAIINVANNDVCKKIDRKIIDYAAAAATVTNTITYDFGAVDDQKKIVNNLVVDINKVRNAMAADTKRGLPNVLIASTDIASLLTSAISLNFSSYEENVVSRNFVGNLGRMLIYQDDGLDSGTLLLAYGNSAYNFAPSIFFQIINIKATFVQDKDSGEPKLFFVCRYAYGRNPLDSTGAADSKFIKKMKFTLTDYDI